jgi:ornithine lipid hydroxylase
MATVLRNVVRYAGMPVLLAGAVWLTFALLAASYRQVIVVPTMSVAMFLVLLGLERVVAFRVDWNLNDGQRFNDVGHSLFGTALGASLGDIATQALVGVFASMVAGSGRGIWPRELPIALQVALVFVLADLGRYVQHRLMHTYPVLWRFHELHHATNVLNVLKTTRSHLVERFTQQIFLFGPALLLGASSKAVLPFVIVNSFLGAFDHSNVDFRLGPLEYVIMGPLAHRIHHSRNAMEGNRNFGTALLVWDWVFRTYQAPLTRSDLEWQSRFDVGIEGDRTPVGFLAQIIDPFRFRPSQVTADSLSSTGSSSADSG